MTFPDEKATITELLKRFPNPASIVDLGAHEGEDTEWMLDVLYDKLEEMKWTLLPRAIMVEADRINYDILRSKHLPAGAVYGAIAAYTGTCDFYECRASGGGYGSIYAPNEGLSVDHSDFHKQASATPCFTFDDLCRQEGIDHIDLLWVDIHGAEKDMIAHGQEALKRTRYLFMEAVGQRMYKGSATRDELVASLPGWTLVKEFPWNLLLRNDKYQN